MATSYNSERSFAEYEGTIKTTDVTVSGTTSTMLPPVPLRHRKDFLLINSSSSTIYVGGQNVTRYDGIPVISGTVFTMPLGQADLYAVTSAAATTVSGIRILEVS